MPTIHGVGTSSATRIERHDSILPLAEEWDGLAERAGAPPFLQAGWFDAWLTAFGGRASIAALRRDGRLAGVLPLVRRAGSLRSATNWHTPLFGPLAEDEDASAELAAAAVRERASRLDLAFLDPRDPGTQALRAAARAAGARLVERTIVRQPYVDVSGPWSAYEERLARKQRKELRRVRRRLEDEGELRIQFERGMEGLDEGLAIEGSGWKSERGTAIASEPEAERFYREVARWAAERGALVLAFLRLDGRPLAFDMCLEQHGVQYVLKGGFDPAYRRFSPGALLTYESLARAFESDLHSYEFLGTDDPYKLAWSDGVRERVRLQAFPRTPAGLVERLAWTHGRRVAKGALAAIAREQR